MLDSLAARQENRLPDHLVRAAAFRGWAIAPFVRALIVFGGMSYARLMRGNTLVERERDYVQATMATGVSRPRIMFRHLLPNVTSGLFVLVAGDGPPLPTLA